MPTPPSSNARRTRASVHLMDAAAERIITLGGVVVLAAVLTICLYLVYVVSPLFSAGSASPRHAATTNSAAEPAMVFIDEYLQASAILGRDGVLRTSLLESADPIDVQRLVPEGRTIESFDRLPGESRCVLGLDDGSIILAEVSFASRLLTPAQVQLLSDYDSLATPIASLATGRSIALPAEAIGNVIGDPAHDSGGLIEAIDTDGVIEFRLTNLAVQLGDPMSATLGEGPTTRVALAQTAGGLAIAQIRSNGTAMLHHVIERRPLGGGPVRRRLVSREIQIKSIPDELFVMSSSSDVLGVDSDGTIRRYAPADSQSLSPLVLIEQIHAVPEGTLVTSSEMLAGSRSILVGDNAGRVHAWFVGKDPLAATADHRRLIRSNTYRISAEAITSLVVSGRDRIFAAEAADRRAYLVHATSSKHIASIDLQSPILAWAMSPKGDAIVAVQADKMMRTWSIDSAFPGASLAALFGPIRYEDSKEPTEASYVYQSSSASDDAEAKLSLVPLIFGTLKATVFAMLFATPIAVLAALYTSEFMRPKTRRFVKPAVELMATLPSVVLGFIAAMIVAPYVRDHLLTIVLLLVVVPGSVLIAATVFRSLRPASHAAESGTTRTVGVLLTLTIASLATIWLSPQIERLVFSPSRDDVLIMAGSVEPVAADEIPEWVGSRRALSPHGQRRLACEGLAFQSGVGVIRPREPADDPGDTDHAGPTSAEIDEAIRTQNLDRPGLIRWLDGEIRSPKPGWIMILSPIFLAIGLVIRAWIRGSPTRAAAQPNRALSAITLIATLAASVTLALALAAGLSSMCLDPRDSILGPFTQRNTLVVAIVMGVAIIPIIYTISEDAMRSVPNSLRLASLGAGATPWQTAVRIVLPVAGSGVFSACMIGLGRAVGETMIVLMATGSTPEMSTNIFSGFRTLAANIAMELPEAPKDDTLYRVLFLCGLVLFVVTFAINTTAEIVRQRFRKRNASL